MPWEAGGKTLGNLNIPPWEFCRGAAEQNWSGKVAVFGRSQVSWTSVPFADTRAENVSLVSEAHWSQLSGLWHSLPFSAVRGWQRWRSQVKPQVSRLHVFTLKSFFQTGKKYSRAFPRGRTLERDYTSFSVGGGLYRWSRHLTVNSFNNYVTFREGEESPGFHHPGFAMMSIFANVLPGFTSALKKVIILICSQFSIVLLGGYSFWGKYIADSKQAFSPSVY